MLDEKVSGSVTRTYAYGLQRISENQLVSGTWKPSFYGYDGHGNVRLLENTAGAVTDTYQYDAFGMPIASTGTTANNFRYSGEWSDSSIGLYHLRDRYYNQATGRFWTRDSLEGVLCTPLSFNPYIYALDDAVDRVDPTGDEALVEYLLLIHFIPQIKVAVPRCFAQLKYRPVDDPRARLVNFTHSYWYVQDRTGTQYVASGGPEPPYSQKAQTRYLNVWVHDPSQGPDTPGAGQTWYDSGLSYWNCKGVDNLLKAARNWPNNTIVYGPVFGPNSNTAAQELGAAGGFFTFPPPGASGW